MANYPIIGGPVLSDDGKTVIEDDEDFTERGPAMARPQREPALVASETVFFRHRDDTLTLIKAGDAVPARLKGLPTVPAAYAGSVWVPVREPAESSPAVPRKRGPGRPRKATSGEASGETSSRTPTIRERQITARELSQEGQARQT